MVSLRRHKRLRPCSGSSSGLAPPPGFCDNGTALQTSTHEKPDNVHLAPSNNVNQSEERQKAAFLASNKAEKAALASLKTLESQIAEERKLWGEARSKLEADLGNSRVRLVALESELKVSKESLANVQSEFHDAREAWEHMVEEALVDMREDHEQERERLIEMLMAKPIIAKEPTQAEERRLWGEARSKLEVDLCNSRVRLVALESELKVSKESLANVQCEFHDAQKAWEYIVEEALSDMREDNEQERVRLIEMLDAKPIKAKEPTQAEERRLWGEARSKLEADLSNSRVRLVALESELKVSKESLANVQREFHDAQEAWEYMAEEALVNMREDHEQERERLIEMCMAKPIKAKEPTQASPSQAIPQDFGGQTNKGPNEVSNT